MNIRKIVTIFLILTVCVPLFVNGQTRQNAEALQPKSKRIGKEYEKTNGLFRFDVIGGVNLSQFDGDEVVGFNRVGANVGLGATLPFTDYWSISMELLYSMKGASNQPKYQNGYYLYNLNLDYIEIPILARFSYDVFSVGVGFSYGRLVNFKETVHGGYEMAGSLEEAQAIWGAEYVKTGFEPFNSGMQEAQYAIPLDVYNPQTGVWAKDSKWAPGMFTTSKMKQNDWSILVDLKCRVWKNLSVGVRYTYSLAPLREETYISDALSGLVTEAPNERLYDKTLYQTTGQVQRINDGMAFNSRKQYNNTISIRAIWTFNWNGKTVREKNREM